LGLNARRCAGFSTAPVEGTDVTWVDANPSPRLTMVVVVGAPSLPVDRL
jgi:hypothetical protein